MKAFLIIPLLCFSFTVKAQLDTVHVKKCRLRNYDSLGMNFWARDTLKASLVLYIKLKSRVIGKSIIGYKSIELHNTEDYYLDNKLPTPIGFEAEDYWVLINYLDEKKMPLPRNVLVWFEKY